MRPVRAQEEEPMASTTTTPVVDVDAMSESEFLAFLIRQLQEVAGPLTEAVDRLKSSVHVQKAALARLGLLVANDQTPARHLSLVQGEGAADDA
jgi:hypothetical protein